ncbi:hypothetical protein DASC09_015050 [Saccharomycopsis crataegensis]|uniref:MYND-type domain-containing protein n=1 Tax=Saccharomycopsis crataegensis TaxID=43959 RepID=A0AAV5QGX1_9ASCO|nr:hypothetical protein DASC09_015050 [Saccharomycopsis crataegensis]
MCEGSVCYFCNKKSWVSCGAECEEHTKLAMGSTPKEMWCDCANVFDEASKYPPSAGTGHRRSSSIISVTSINGDDELSMLREIHDTEVLRQIEVEDMITKPRDVINTAHEMQSSEGML